MASNSKIKDNFRLKKFLPLFEATIKSKMIL